MDRAILHIRIPSFFAEVERNRRPELAGTPIIVAKARGNTSGVVVSASAEAMKLGVVDGMSVRHANRSCPDAVVITADNDFYRQLFDAFLDILVHCSPLVEPTPPDGAYLDVTGSRKLFGDPIKISRRIIARVEEKLGLSITIGCASNKLVAGIASRTPASLCFGGSHFAPKHATPPSLRGEHQPRSIAVGHVVNVCIGSEATAISTLPVTVLDSVSGKIAKQLNDLGITTVEQLALIPEKLLIRRFGPLGSVMMKQSLGMDVSQVKAAYPPLIITSEHTFASPLEEPAQIEEYLAQMTADAAANLRRKSALAGEVALKLFDQEGTGNREQGTEGNSLNAQRSTLNSAYFHFKKPTDSAATLQQALVKMLHDKMQPGMEVCKVQVVLSDLTPGESSQLCLIGDGERKNRLDRAADLIRERFGDGAIFSASSLATKGKARVLRRVAA